MIAAIEYKGTVTPASMAPGMPTSYDKDYAAKEWRLYTGEYVFARYCRVIRYIDTEDMDEAIKEYPELMV